MFEVAGRRIKVATGIRTQTVNICTSAGRWGEYEFIVRMRPPFTTEAELVSKRFASINQLIAHLRDAYAGEMEVSPGLSPCASVGAGASVASKPRHIDISHVPLSSWAERARAATESAINQLVLEFMMHPYHHRVEHSIHCRLFELMADQSALQLALPFGRKWATQPIHKEWPESSPRPEKGNRRGNFDLVVLSPEIVRDATILEFRRGTIRPSLAIEMGLDYKLGHLQADIQKLKNSGILDSYVIHLVRQDVPDDFESVERCLLEYGSRSAYVRHMGTRVRYKRLEDPRIEETSA
jgi:hypothetical protein